MKKPTKNKKPRRKRKPPKDILKYKARNLRSSMRARARRSGDNPEDVPTVKEFENWFNSQELVCYYTQEPIVLKDLQVDHKQPRSRGGTDKLSNLCITSSGINRAKGNMTAEEFQGLLELIWTWEDRGDTLLRRLKQAWRY